MPSRELFVRNAGAADSEYNATTFSLLFEFIREKGSRQAGSRNGAQLRADSILGIISTLNAFLSRLAGSPILNDGAEAAVKQAGKQARRQDGPPGDRAVQAPLRAVHLRAAFRLGLERASAFGKARAACLLVGHNTLARGEDLGTQGAVDIGRDLTIGAFDLTSGAGLTPPALVIWMCASKDPTQHNRRSPMVVQRRSASGPLGADPMCTYDAILTAWPILADTIPKNQWHTTLFFRTPRVSGDPPSAWRSITANDVGTFVNQAAIAAGIDPAPLGIRSLRMGGATDLYDIHGAAGERYIRERGRWSSDIAQIYQRVSARLHGELSRTIGDSTGVDLQSLLAGWSQAAITHGRCPI
jgi:hypothetical protein